MVYAHIGTDPRSILQEQLPSILRRWSKWFTEPFSSCKSNIWESCLEVFSCYLWKCECWRKKGSQDVRRKGEGQEVSLALCWTPPFYPRRWAAANSSILMKQCWLERQVWYFFLYGQRLSCILSLWGLRLWQLIRNGCEKSTCAELGLEGGAEVPGRCSLPHFLWFFQLAV